MVSKSDLKYVSALQIKKFRQKYGQFIVEGEKCVAELLKSNYGIRSIFASERWINENRKAIAGSISLHTATDEELKKMSHHQTAPQVMAIAHMLPENSSLPELKGRFSLALDTIQDPGNLGTIIRIADWYGIRQILCSENCADYLNPKCLSATMGSFTRVGITYTNLDALLATSAVQSFACVLGGSSVYELPVLKEGIILIGNEGKGLSDSLIHAAGSKISIPRIGEAESLNAAIATAVICDNLIGRSRH